MKRRRRHIVHTALLVLSTVAVVGAAAMGVRSYAKLDELSRASRGTGMPRRASGSGIRSGSRQTPTGT